MARMSEGKVSTVEINQITEDVKYFWYDSLSHMHPLQGDTIPNPEKNGAYSWVKAPRYNGESYEVGPLARMKMAYETHSNTKINQLIDDTLNKLQIKSDELCSVMGRHIMRALECKVVAEEISGMIMQVKLDELVCVPHKILDSAEGMGLWDAARGALGHWIEIQNQKIARYQAIVPTTWNASPKDDKGQAGPIEVAMVGTVVDDINNPFELARIVCSFDPCLACAVHLAEAGKTRKSFQVV